MKADLTSIVDRGVPAGRRAFSPAAARRFLGIDLGAETIKLVELRQEDGELRVGRREILEHGKSPGLALQAALARWEWEGLNGVVASGRFSRQVNLPQAPTKQAQVRGFRFLFGNQAATVVSIGSHGFSVLELRGTGRTLFRENSRCSQGTGNFLRQLVERFSLSVEEASALCAEVASPAPLSGRCPVILKTDMTHLANKGEDRARILAGLFDAVCENVLVLIKPGVSPKRVLLVGGVSRSPRVRRVFAEALERDGMSLMTLPEEDSLCLEALGCAVLAAESPQGDLPALDELLNPPPEVRLERLPALAQSLPRVRRMATRPWAEVNGEPRRIVLGFDIGSTGSKVVALDADSNEVVWEAYRQTLGNPVGAAQDLLRRYVEGPVGHKLPLACGVTGSGREIAGSLLISCYGGDAVFVLNEIVAHATGALHYDPRVDTIFEIGGQDAKYIRLAGGRIIDCAMNEACSAGTGSFIEEQGRKFAGVEDVRQLGKAALAAPFGVSLGQHCSVFMAEVIDEAVAAGIEQPAIISGLYDSIIKNYLNRVKGSRSVGQVIFCQGMPFSADALACAVARQTGSEVIVPPNPGTVGSLGIALLAARELKLEGRAPLDPALFLGAKVESKDSFLCKATRGCGGAGNKCRIDRLTTMVAGQRHNFTWGGGCALHDKGTRKRKLPDLAPDPFREREELLAKVAAPFIVRRGRPRVALSDEFMLKGLFPFFSGFLHEAGFDLVVLNESSQADLKRGIQSANVPFCAPMQLFHGLVERMLETQAEFLFLPMVRTVPRVEGQVNSVTCPIVQASPDILRWDLGQTGTPSTGSNCASVAAAGGCSSGCALCGSKHAEEAAPAWESERGCPRPQQVGGNGSVPAVEGDRAPVEPKARTIANQPRIISPVIDIGEGNLESEKFKASLGRLARELNLSETQTRAAWAVGFKAQTAFDLGCLELGRRALDFCEEQDITPVVVLGRAYTIYNKVLNSNVPAILREQGAIGIPVDCFPLDADVPVFNDMYWGYGQQNLRTAHQVRATEGVYALYCSNYSCGPDSFNLHFTAHVMEGKPFAIIETDGHSGDAGTKTRVEAFLHCVEEDRHAACGCGATRNDFREAQVARLSLGQLQTSGTAEKLLVPYLGACSEVVAAVFRGVGWPSECLSPPDVGALRGGRRYTSGKECLPMTLTLGVLLQRLESEPDPAGRFVYLMPGAQGPCRFGVYNLLNQIVLGRQGWREKVKIWSPDADHYFDGFPPGTSALMYTGFVASDLLTQALLDARPTEREPGAANATYARYHAELLARLEQAGREGLPVLRSLWQVASLGLFGVKDILERAATDFAALRDPRPMPVALVVGEIYVRLNDFSNDFVIRKLEARGIKTRLAPATEWLEYCDDYARREGRREGLGAQFSTAVQRRIQVQSYAVMARALGWPDQVSVPEALDAAEPYLRRELDGEAVITVGFPVHEYRHGDIHAVVNVGPLECMPSKIAEAQFCHVAEREGLPSLTLAFNGDPIGDDALDNFAFEVKSRFSERAKQHQKAVLALNATS